MTTENAKNFIEDIKNEKIPVGEMNTGKDEFFFSVGLLEGYFVCHFNDTMTNKEIFHHCRNIGSVCDFFFQRYKANNHRLMVDCHWQKQLVAIISEGKERFGKDTPLDSKDEENFTMGHALAIGYPDLFK